MSWGHKVQPIFLWSSVEAVFPSKIWEKGTQPRSKHQLVI